MMMIMARTVLVGLLGFTGLVVVARTTEVLLEVSTPPAAVILWLIIGWAGGCWVGFVVDLGRSARAKKKNVQP